MPIMEASSEDDNNDDEDMIDFDSVSDTEALLACYAYLQRKNMLSEWSSTATTSKQENGTNKNKKEVNDSIKNNNNHRIHIQNDETTTNGYFWENLNELRYYHRKHPNDVVRRRIRRLPTTRSNNTTTTTTTNSTRTNPVLKSIEGTKYKYIENFVPPVENDDDDYLMYDHTLDTDINVVGEVMATKRTTDLKYIVSSESFTTSKNGNSINNNVWDIIEDDDIGTPDSIDTTTHMQPPPMYRKNYRILNEDNEYYMNDYHRNDDDTLEVLLFRQRSQRSQLRFQNSTWKEEWYARRWGNGINTTTTMQHASKDRKLNRRLQKKMRSSSRHSPSSTSIPKESLPFYAPSMVTTTHGSNDDDLSAQSMGLLLRHSQLISRLDNDVIADAITTYVSANRKRSVRRKCTNQHRRTFLRQQYYNIVAKQGNNTVINMNRTASVHNITAMDPFPQPVTKVRQRLHHYHTLDHEEAMTTIILSEEERQRQRGEKAKKAYQTRLYNEKLRSRNEMDHTTTNQIPSFLKDDAPCCNDTTSFDCDLSNMILLTPMAAYERVDRLLSSLSDDDTQQGPIFCINIHEWRCFQRDVELVLHPKKLPHRKTLMLRIMRDLFQLHGRCIPVSDSNRPTICMGKDDDDIASIPIDSCRNTASMSSSMTRTFTKEYKFMTKASVQELGSFILQKTMDNINCIERNDAGIGNSEACK